MVPEPSRSPTFIAQPDEAWCMSCCTDDQYMYLKLVRQRGRGFLHFCLFAGRQRVACHNCLPLLVAGKLGASDPEAGCVGTVPQFGTIMTQQFADPRPRAGPDVWAERHEGVERGPGEDATHTIEMD